MTSNTIHIDSSSAATPGSKPLSISAAWITPILGRGGYVMYMGPLLKRLSHCFSEFSVISAEYGGSTTDLDFNVQITGGVHRFYRPDPLGYARGFTLIGPSIFIAMLRSKADLLLLTEFSLTTAYGLLACRMRRRLRAVVIVETRPWPAPRGLTSTLRRHIRRYLARSADAVLTNNNDGLQYVCDELGVPTARVVAEPYLVSEMKDAFHDAEISLRRFTELTPKSKINFLYVGELIERKGVQDAIAAFGKLGADYRDRFAFHVIGDGPLSEPLKAKCEELGIAQHVVFHGRQPYENLGTHYAAAHVFVFPTHRDYRALTPFEALSMGLPILGSIYDGGICETVVDGENGYRFDPFNTTQLTHLIETILLNPEQLSRFSSKSREIAKRYTLDNAVAAIMTTCQIALSGKRCANSQ